MKKTIFALLLLGCAFAANAKSFALQVIQKNTPGDDVFETSFIVEQAILDYFFERGMIVSNSAVIVGNKGADSENLELRRSFIEAKAGSMDLFVKLYLNYTIRDSLNPTAVLLSNIQGAEIEIVSLASSETLLKGSFVPEKVTTSNNNQGGVESFATDIAMKIQAKLAEKGGAI